MVWSLGGGWFKVKSVALLRAVLVVCLFWSAYALAATMDEEIEHLMQFVATSDCIYLRNGKEYEGGEAVKHISKKYRYFKKEIFSAEEFIKYSATQSTVTKRPYLIRCPGGSEERARDWLLNELRRFRALSGL